MRQLLSVLRKRPVILTLSKRISKKLVLICFLKIRLSGGGKTDGMVSMSIGSECSFRSAYSVSARRFGTTHLRTLLVSARKSRKTFQPNRRKQKSSRTNQSSVRQPLHH